MTITFNSMFFIVGYLNVCIYICMYVFVDYFLFFYFAGIADLVLWKLKFFDLTTPNSSVATSVSLLSWNMPWTALHFLLLLSLDTFHLSLWHTCSKWLALLHPAQLLLYSGHLCGSCKVPQYLHLSWGIFLPLFELFGPIPWWSVLFTPSNFKPFPPQHL